MTHRLNLNHAEDAGVPRQRSARALSNDEAIRASAVELILSDGIDAISFREVGRVAGLTHGALYARFEDVEELLIDLWDAELSHRAITMMTIASQATADPSDENVHRVVS